MIKIHPFSRIVLFLFCICCNIVALDTIDQLLLQRNSFSYETALEQLRNQEISIEQLTTISEISKKENLDFSDLMSMYYSQGCDFEFLAGTEKKSVMPESAKRKLSYAKKYQFQNFSKIKNAVDAVWSDAVCFPVGQIESKPSATVSFANSWMQSRTYGGDRVHEGTDIMPSLNERGIYPILSMTKGIIEKIGWLPLGGYRIGIRSPSGGYFYYAHLSEYAKNFEPGEVVHAGDCIGFMGDTGYGEQEGTRGKFDVHLHLGIYVTIDGVEYSINSYPVLAYLSKNCEIVERCY